MAVETPPPHNNFSPQLLFNLIREIATIMNNHHFYNTQMNPANNISTPSTMPESSSAFFPHPQIPTNNITDSNALPFPHQIQASPQSTFIDTNLLNYLHHQQYSQINNLISQHTENLRTAFEQQRIQQSRMLLSAVEKALAEKLKRKDEKIQKIGTMNLLLEENAMKLMKDTQMWKQKAKTNQDTVIRLDREIKRLKATHVREEHRKDGGGDDVESVCSNEVVKEEEGMRVRKKCIKCGVKEPQMVLMPCKHFCLCTMCGSSLLNCPLCFTGIEVSINVNSSP